MRLLSSNARLLNQLIRASSFLVSGADALPDERRKRRRPAAFNPERRFAALPPSPRPPRSVHGCA